MRLCLALLLIVILGGCVHPPRMKMEVRAYRDPEREFAPYKRFATVKIDQENPLREREILHLVRTELEADGYIYSEDSADFLVVAFSFIGGFQEYVPPRTIPIPRWVPGDSKTTSGWVGAEYVSLTEKFQGKLEWDYAQTTGYTYTSYYRNIKLIFVDVQELMSGGEVVPIWESEVESRGSSFDLLRVAPVMIDEMIGEFPHRSGKDSHRVRYYFDEYVPGEPNE